MSVLTEAYAVPSRMAGVFRYLLHARGQKDSLDALTRMLAPESLGRKGDREADAGEEGAGKDMVRKTVSECLASGLLVPVGDDLALNPALPAHARAELTAVEIFPMTLVNLFFGSSRDTNHDLGLAIAWYLTQDACAAPGNWSDVERVLIDTGLKDTLRLSDVRYHMLEDWVCYLGFGWTHALGDKRLTPDPTAHLRVRLPDLFPGARGSRHPFPEVMGRLAAACPVFEGGSLRTRIEELGFARDLHALSSTTALAWLRLRDEGIVELHHESDALTMLLPDGDQTQPVSHVTLVRPAEGGR